VDEMSFEWRKGQREVYEAMKKYINDNKNIILVAPTGWGKILLTLLDRGADPDMVLTYPYRGYVAV